MLSRFCQSTVVLLRSFSVISTAICFSVWSPKFAHGAFVVGQRVVEGQFGFVEAQRVAALGGGAELLGHLDQFLDHLGAFDGAAAVAVQRRQQRSLNLRSSTTLVRARDFTCR
jgi:hypothetical protein